MTTTSISGTTPLAHTFNGQTLRHVMIEGEPWFHATDVCVCVGLNVRKGTTKATKPLEEGEKRLITPKTFQGGRGRATFISESGLYQIIMRAQRKRPEVVAFQNWVTKEVLPAIRKTGGDLLNEEARETAHADAKEVMP